MRQTVRRMCGWAILAVMAALVWGNRTLATPPPALVLVAFGTSTAAFDTYNHLETQVKKRFPGYEIRWAFTSHKVREKVWQERQQKLHDLPATLKELHQAGFTRVVVQSLNVVPGEEWQEMIKESRQVPGLQVARGEPLLSSPEDQERVLSALAKTFPPDLHKTAVVLVGHGSPHPEGEAAYLAFDARLRSRYPGKNVFFGVVAGKPAAEECLAAVKRSGANQVLFVPFMLVAGEHMSKDILGSQPESWKSQLLQAKPYRFLDMAKGLGYLDEVTAVYLDHLESALKTLNK